MDVKILKPAYLIQRGKFEDRDYKKGIDSIIHFEYMGAAEFEWGALPESLEKIRKNISDYVYHDVFVFHKKIKVFLKKEQIPFIEEYLKTLAKNEFHLHEWSDFDTYIFNKQHYLKTNFWWDIKII